MEFEARAGTPGLASPPPTAPRPSGTGPLPGRDRPGAAPGGWLPRPAPHTLSPSLSRGYYGNKGVIDVG